MDIDPVFSDGSAAENREIHWTCCFVWSGEQAIFQPWGGWFELICFENSAVTPVIIVIARLKAVEFLSESFAEKWPKGLLCASLRNADGPVSGDVGVKDAHGSKRGW